MIYPVNGFPFSKEGTHFYNNDHPCLIRFKHVLLSAGTPIAAVGRAIYHLAMAVFSSIACCTKKDRWAAARLHAQDIGRSIGYGIVMEGFAIAGIFFPRFGRRGYGTAEALLNRHLDSQGRTIKGLGQRTQEMFYLAECFQRITTDQNEGYERHLEHYAKTV